MAEINNINFEEKIKQIKAKHMSRDFNSENKDNDEKLKKFLSNPKLKEIVSLFDNNNNRSKKVDFAYENNSSTKKNFNKRNSEIIVGSYKPNIEENPQIEVKDRLKFLRMSLISERQNYSSNGKYESYKSKDKKTKPKEETNRYKEKYNGFSTGFTFNRALTPVSKILINKARDNFFQTKKTELVNLLTLTNNTNYYEAKELKKPTISPIKTFDKYKKGFAMKNDNYFKTNDKRKNEIFNINFI
jgi:hypothetical protein